MVIPTLPKKSLRQQNGRYWNIFVLHYMNNDPEVLTLVQTIGHFGSNALADAFVKGATHTVRVAAVALVFLLWSSRAYGQTPESNQNRQKGDWDLSVWTAGETGEENTNSFTEAQIWSAGFTVGRVLTHDRGPGLIRGSVEYAFDVMPVFQTFGNQRIYGGGFDPIMFRWNSTHHSSHLTPYIAAAGGTVFTSANLPPGETTSFNAMAKAGGGVYIRTRNRQDFDIGLCWSHISNANRGIRNPEFNGLQLSIAYHWYK